MRRNRLIGIALVGLLVVAAISVAQGSGRKPPQEQQTTVSLRPISWSENDTGFIKDVFPLSEITSASLEYAFPVVQFYKGLSGSKPPYPYVMAIRGNRRYTMPGGFNYLLLDGGQEVTDKNIVALAKAFVVSALGNQRMYGNPIFGGPQGDELLAYPEVAFLGAATAKLETGRPTDAATLKVKIGAEVEEWHFRVSRSQFVYVARGGTKGFIMDYLPIMVESLPGRGQ